MKAVDQQRRDCGAMCGEEHGIARVLIADWDVYHGNGTQDIFSIDADSASSKTSGG
jgi:hypothetical protein